VAVAEIVEVQQAVQLLEEAVAVVQPRELVLQIQLDLVFLVRALTVVQEHQVTWVQMPRAAVVVVLELAVDLELTY
jgi:hypothetical protein